MWSKENSILVLMSFAGAIFFGGCGCGIFESDEGCPGGATSKGEKPPGGTEWWCEKDGKKEGAYIRWYDSGSIAEEGEYKKGEKLGIWRETYESGQTRIEAEYDANQKSGKYTSFFENGNKRAEGSYLDGVMDGVWTNYHNNSKLSEQGDMVAGKKNGKWIYYSTSGKKESAIRYVNGVEKVSRGKKPSQKVGSNNDDTDPKGTIRVKNPDAPVGNPDKRCKDGGQIFGNEPPLGKQLWCERDGKKHGMWKQWWESGNRWIDGEYADARKDGLWTEYYDNGIVTSKGKFSLGKEQGPWVFNYANGQARTKGQFKDGKKEGKWIEYHQDGRTKGEKTF